MPLCISPSVDGATISLRVAGDIDLATEPMLSEAIQKAVAAEDVDAVVVDLAGIAFMDCHGLSALIRGRRSAREAGRGFRVTNAVGIARVVMDMTGVSGYLGA
jgi:anti-sigma B factor antagonist